MEKEKNVLFRALSSLNPKPLKELSSQLLSLIETRLWAKVLFGMFLGVALGVALSPVGPFFRLLGSSAQSVESLMSWLTLPAQLFLKLIKMVIIPLIISSVILGLASTTDVTQMKKLGGKFTLFVLFNTVVAAFLGYLLTSFFRPGKGLHLKGAAAASEGQANLLSFGPDTFLSFLPGNPLSSIVEGQMLDVVILSIIAGIAFLSIDKTQAKNIMNMLEVIQQICMKIISWAMRLAPYAVFGMMGQVAFSTGIKSLQNMGFYVAVCFVGFALIITFYLTLVAVLKRQNFFVFLRKISSALLLAFSTSSSAASMPLTMEIAEDELGVDPATARFLIPLGATVNMAGSAIWHTSAVVFLSQAYNVDLSLPQVLFVVATSIGSAVGSPGVPGVGIGILATILVKVGIPIEGVSLIIGVDRIVDMGCTAVNVAGDLTAAHLLSES